MKTTFASLVRGSAQDLCKSAWRPCISISCLTLLALFLFASAALERRAFGATPERAPRAVATAIAGASAQLNGVRLIPGATLFGGDVVKLGPDSSAVVQMNGRNDLVIATPGTEFRVEAEGIKLRTGRVRVRLAGADMFPVTGPFFHVNVAASGGNSGSADISISGKSAQVAAVTGVADILMDGSETLHRVDAGKIAMMDDASGQDSSLSVAGENSASSGAPPTPGQSSQPSGKSPRTIYIISAAVGGAAIGVGLWLSSREGVSPDRPQ
jgi:hypothetical protein